MILISVDQCELVFFLKFGTFSKVLSMRQRDSSYAIVLLLVLAGCSSNNRVAVSGDVTLDGKPLDGGAISFRPAPGNASSSSGGQIRQGRFQLTADRGLAPGKYLVTVQAFQPTGRTIKDGQSGQMVPEQAEVKYREVGKLEAVVAASGTNQFQFQLTSITR